MKKYFTLAAMAAVALTMGFTACNDDDDDNEVIDDKPQKEERDTQYQLKAFLQFDRIGKDDDQTKTVLQTYHEALHQLDSIGEQGASMTVSVKGADSLACINALLAQCKQADATLAKQELKGDANTISLRLESNYKELFSKTYGFENLTNDGLTQDASATVSGKFGDNISWSYAGGTLTITGTGAMEDLGTDPSLWGYSVSYIDAPWFKYSPQVKKLVVGEGITHIGDFNFSTLPATEIQLPKSLTSIGENAFLDCKYLQSIELPESLTEVESGAFNGSGLTSVVLPKGITTLSGGMFGFCSKLTDVTLSADVRAIQNEAFAYTALKTISLPEGIEEIGYGAFQECKNLQSVTIPGKVKTVGECAFYGCSALETVTIKEGVEEISSFAFYQCYSIKTISLPSTLQKIKTSAFGNAYDASDIYCYATTPPVFTSPNALPYYYEDESVVVVHVPGSSIEAYKADKYWSRYPDYVAL